MTFYDIAFDVFIVLVYFLFVYILYLFIKEGEKGRYD